MEQIKLGIAVLALASVGMLSACSGNDGAPGDETGGTTSGDTTGGATTGGDTTGGATTGGDTTGGDTTGGATTGGDTTGGATTGGDTTGGNTTGGATTGGDTTGGATTGGETTGGSTGGGSASACFNDKFSKVGTRLIMKFKTTDGASGITVTTDSNSLNNQMTTYNGHNALETVSVVDAVASDPRFSSKSTTKSYIAVDTGAKSSQLFGTVTDVTTPAATTLTTKIEPAQVVKWNLDPGESHSQTFTITTSATVTTAGMSFPVPDTTTNTTQKRLYVGRDSITVPAGTFETCHFQEDSTVSGNTSSTDVWFSVGSGVQIKAVADGDVTELLSASIDGSPIN